MKNPKSMKKEVVRKSNVFIDGRYRFGLHEQKILLLVVSQIRTSHEEFFPYRVGWHEIKRVTKNGLNSVAKIDKACESLKNKTISIRSGKTVDNFGFLSGWKTCQGKYVEFRIDPGMKEMLLGLLETGNFTLYDLEFALALPSSHSIRMYEVLKSLVWRKQPVDVQLDQLKYCLDVDVKSVTYANFSNFRRFILDRARKNLEKYTDIVFDYEPIKESRKVVAVRFTINDNKKFQRTIQAESTKKFIRPGDLVLIGDQECIVDSSACYYEKEDRYIPIGDLTRMFQQGAIHLIERKND